MNNNQKQIAPLETITASTLMKTEFDPLHFSIEKLLPQGIFILAGSGKIGKSWLALDMCVAVSTGGRLWDYNASYGDVLYLALEDTHPRLQNRLQLIQEENINTDKLHLAISSLGISDGLITQMKEFLSTNPSTKLIVIDTLERIRNTDQDKSMYACDYRDMTALREITNAHAVTLLLVHHTRKMYDPDPLNTLSGSTGLVGAVDGVWVLEKEKRIGEVFYCHPQRNSPHYRTPRTGAISLDDRRVGRKAKLVERGELTADAFLSEIVGMTSALVKTYEMIKGADTLFPSDRESVGKCPRCGGAVTENKKGFCCSDKACGFAVWKENRFFTAKKKTVTKAIVAELLKNGKVSLTGGYSEKTGKTYDCVAVLDDTDGQFVNFTMEFAAKRK